VSIRVWKHPADDSLLIQFDEDQIYALADGCLDLEEWVEPVTSEWIELIPERCHAHLNTLPCEHCRMDGTQ
jgi:hypothetical protein